MKAWLKLLSTAARSRFEPHDIASQLDGRGHYAVPLDDEFPLLVKRLRYTSPRHMLGATWHDRLELFMPLDGPARFRMGEQEMALQPGDLLVVDNLKRHHVVDFPGFDTRVIVISFMPEFVSCLGSPSHDYAFLLPLYSKVERRPHVPRAREPNAPEAHDALGRLLDCHFAGAKMPFFRAGTKALLLELLYHLAAHFHASEVMKRKFVRQQGRSLRLKKLFGHINAQPAEKLPNSCARRIAPSRTSPTPRVSPTRAILTSAASGPLAARRGNFSPRRSGEIRPSFRAALS